VERETKKIHHGYSSGRNVEQGSGEKEKGLARVAMMGEGARRLAQLPKKKGVESLAGQTWKSKRPVSLPKERRAESGGGTWIGYREDSKKLKPTWELPRGIKRKSVFHCGRQE